MPLGEPQVSRFPNGVVDRLADHAMGSLPFLDPTKFHTYFNDFDAFVAGDWTITEVTAGAPTQALTAGDGGLLLLTNTAADDDSITLQKNPASFGTVTAGKRMWFACKFEVNDATQSDVLVGLTTKADTTPIAGVTDGIFFQKDDGDTDIDVYVKKDSSTGEGSKTAVGTLVDDTQIVLAWYYDGVDTVYFYIDGEIAATLDASSTFLPDATDMSITMAIQNGEGVAKTMTIDHVLAVKER